MSTLMPSKAPQPDYAIRRAVLDDIRSQYLTNVVGVRSRFAAGIGLPPADYINQELMRLGLSWRVGAVHGGRCEFRNI